MKLNKPVAFYLILIALTAFLGAVVFGKIWAHKPIAEAPSSAMREQLYQVEVVKMLNDFRGGKGTAMSRAAVVEKKLLELAVPEKFRESHLDLVLAMHAVAVIQARDTKGLESASAKLEKVFEKYSWLK